MSAMVQEARALLRVLLVEDDPADAYLVSELLAEVDAAVELTVAPSMRAVVDDDLLDGRDCVLLDLNTPGTTGLDGLRRLLDLDPAAAVCVLTGTDDEHLGNAAVALGAQDYLVKGRVDGTLLARSIRYAVERRNAQLNLRRLREAELLAAEASRLERGLLPRPLIGASRVEVLPFYRSARRSAVLGGDFYDVVERPDGTVHAIIGDVCGHAADQAALGALVRVSWRALVLAGVPEPDVLPALQEVLVTERHDRSLFTTACTVMLEPADGGATPSPAGVPAGVGSGAAHGVAAHVRLAGHPAPVLLRPDPVALTGSIGLPLGVSAGARWNVSRAQLPPRWALLMYTDGLIEGAGPEPPDRLWDTGLLTLLDTERETPLPDLPSRLVERAEQLNDGPLPDDVAILLLAGGPA